MNKRQNNLLIEIADKYSGTPLLIQSFAKTYEVSEQTIKNDIREINHILQEHQQPIINIDDNGRVYTSSILNLSFFDDVNFYTYKLSPSERKTVLAMFLLTMDRYTTIAELSEKVMVSRNTLINNLDDLKGWFQENDLSFMSQHRKGLILVGSEINIRKGILKLLLLNDFIYEHEKKLGNDIFHTLLLQEMNGDDKLVNIKAALKDAEAAADIFLTDFSFREMSYFLLVVVSRMEKDKFIGDLNPDKWNQLRRSSKGEFAEIIFTTLCTTYGLDPRHEELAYIIEQLRGESYIKNRGMDSDSDMIDIQILINEFIYKLSMAYDIHYYLNFYLYDLLLTHMKTMAYRMKQNHALNSPILAQLEGEYEEMFQKVEEYMQPLETYLNAKISRDEIAFIVMYLLAILEKNKITDISIDTLLVCNTGLGSAQLILAKISSVFKQIKVVDIVSSHRLEGMSLQEVDMILSTVPLTNSKVPYVQISPLLTDADINGIQNIIMQMQRDKRRSYGRVQSTAIKVQQPVDESVLKQGQALCQLLSSDMVLLDAKADNWRQAVELSGEILYANNKVEKQYIQSMIQNIEENGPYVVIFPGIAIPHAEHSDGALQVGASLVRLEEPVRFHHKENDPVTFVIAFSVIDSGSIGRALYNLTKMLSADQFIQQLSTAKNATALMEVIKLYESRIDVAGR